MPENNGNFFLQGAKRLGAEPNEARLYDLLVVEGKVQAFGPSGSFEAPHDVTTQNADGNLLFPSFIDAHVHLREPGFEYKEDIASGLQAAAHGGFGAVMAMGNTRPVNDCAAVTRLMLDKAAALHPHGPFLHPVGALSLGLEGNELAPMGELAEAGVKAISNDGRPVRNNELFRRAVEYAATWGLKVIDHCEDPDLSTGVQMNEGSHSTEFGLKGQSTVGEALQVARDILLSEYLDLPVHLAHISARQSVELIRWAKSRGVKVTAETCPHYLLLDDSLLADYSTLFKVSPPLRSKNDVQAMLEAVNDGTIDILVTDHAPHAAHEKEVPFDEAPNGFIGLETALPLVLGLVRQGAIRAERLEELMCHKPAEIFKLRHNRFQSGDPADFVLVNPEQSWLVDANSIHSKSLNSPWLGRELRGKVVGHWLGGYKIV